MLKARYGSTAAIYRLSLSHYSSSTARCEYARRPTLCLALAGVNPSLMVPCDTSKASRLTVHVCSTPYVSIMEYVGQEQPSSPGEVHWPLADVLSQAPPPCGIDTVASSRAASKKSRLFCVDAGHSSSAGHDGVSEANRQKRAAGLRGQ